MSLATRQPRYRQVADRILSECAGDPGHPLPGERELAERFGVSRGTVIAALNELERQHRVERLPARGTFLTEHVPVSSLRMILPFPAPGITTAGMLPENLAIVQEIQRGLIDAALESGDAITFQHFPEVAADIALSGQVQRLAAYDAAIFIGRQLGELRGRFAATGRPCVQIASNEDPQAQVAGVSGVDYDLGSAFDLLLSSLAARGYRQVGVLMCGSDPNGVEARKLALFTSAAVRCGLDCPSGRIFRLEDAPPTRLGELVLDRIGPRLEDGEVLYCLNTVMAEALMRLLSVGRITVQGFPFFASASGLTLRLGETVPTHIRVPCYQLGRMAHQAAVTAHRTGVPSRMLIGAELVPGTTT